MSKIFDDLMNGLDEVDSFLNGDSSEFRVHVPSEVDVKGIRRALGMTQASFSNAFGFSLDAVKHWEGGRRTPESSARAYLTVIARDPEAVITALRSTPLPRRKKQAAPAPRGKESSPAGTRTRKRAS